MKAMIFAAGLGTRLRPLTDKMPKALVPVRGEAMLGRVIRKIQAAGVNDFVVNTHHFADQVGEYLSHNGNFGSHIDVSREDDGPLETGGGIKRAARFLSSPKPGRFLVHNVDILSNLDISWFIRQDAAGDDCLASLLVCNATDADRYLLFDREMKLAGWTNIRTGEVKSPYPDFDPAACTRLSFCGIHILSPRVFALMDAWPEKFSIIDFYLSLAATEKIRAVTAPDGFRLIDIGSPEKLAEAESSNLE